MKACVYPPHGAISLRVLHSHFFGTILCLFHFHVSSEVKERMQRILQQFDIGKSGGVNQHFSLH